VAILAIAGSMAIAPVSESAPPDTSGWKCERCPFEQGYQADFKAGGTYASEDNSTFGDATGYDEQGGYLNVDGDGRYANGAYRQNWLIEDLALDSRVIRVEGGHAGSFDYLLGYSQLPRHRYDDTSTIFASAEDDRLTLPAGWTFAGTTAGFTDLAASLVSQDIESERKTLELGGRYLPTARFRLFANYRRQEREGTQVLGAPYFTNSSLLPHRFEYQTDEVEAGIQYDGKAGHLKFAYYGSFFQDGNLAARWESPFLTTPGAEQGAMAEAPDNDFQQLSLTGSYRTAFLDTDLAFSAALGRGSQDDALLPYTTNASLVTPPLPRASLDGEVDTTNLALTAVSRPFARAHLKVAIRYDERDNQTAQAAWTRVIADTFLSSETESNVSYSYDRLRLNLSADYGLFDGVDVAAGYDRTELDRDFQEVAEQTEDAGWGQVRWQPTPYLDMTARGGVSRREVGRYDETVAAGLDQNPLLRKFNLAYRYRQFGELWATTTSDDWPVAISARASYADDSYSSTVLGLTDGDELRIAADVSWPVSEKVFAYLTAGYDEVNTVQTGSAAFAGPDWRANQSDEFYDFGGGIRITGIADKVDFQLDYTRAQGTTRIDVTGGGSPGRFPDLQSTLDSLRARMAYRWSEKLEVGLQLRYEALPTEDWALQHVNEDTLPTILTLGAQPYDDEVWLVGLDFRYLLGGR
jgi:MtrB/PioB family decaheme-associated outer membrane protein